MTSKPEPQAPGFNFRSTPTEWRAVDLSTTKGIARRCTSGMDFVGCSKALVYECVAKPSSSSKSKPEKFVHLMDAAARISQRLNMLASQFDADQPPEQAMKLHLPLSVLMAGRYDDLWNLGEDALVRLLYLLHHQVTGGALGVYPDVKERLHDLWLLEEQLPVEFRRLYYRELCGTARRFDESNGHCLGADAYEWALIHPTAKERARALCATYLIAMIKQLYDEGVDHPILDHLRDQFSDQASEAGCNYEPDHDHEDWNEKHFDQLFAPLEEGYKP